MQTIILSCPDASYMRPITGVIFSLVDPPEYVIELYSGWNEGETAYLITVGLDDAVDAGVVAQIAALDTKPTGTLEFDKEFIVADGVDIAELTYIPGVGAPSTLNILLNGAAVTVDSATPFEIVTTDERLIYAVNQDNTVLVSTVSLPVHKAPSVVTSGGSGVSIKPPVLDDGPPERLVWEDEQSTGVITDSGTGAWIYGGASIGTVVPEGPIMVHAGITIKNTDVVPVDVGLNIEIVASAYLSPHTWGYGRHTIQPGTWAFLTLVTLYDSTWEGAHLFQIVFRAVGGSVEVNIADSLPRLVVTAVHPPLA